MANRAFTRSGGIQGVGLAGTDFVSRGVVDVSGQYAGQAQAALEANKQIDLQTIGAGVEAGLKTAKTLGTAVVMAGVEQSVQDLVDNYTTVVNAPMELAGLDMTSNSLWANIGNKQNPSRIEDIDVVEEKHRTTLNKLSRAYKEGAITSLADLEARVLQVTRQAVNRTPGLANEIISQTQQSLHLSGVRSMRNPLAEAAEQQAKQEAATMKMITDYHVRNKIPFDPLQPDMYAMSQTMQEDLISQQKSREFKQMIENKDLLEKEQVKGFMRNDFPHLARNTYNGLREIAMQVFQPGVSYEQASLQFRTLAEEAKANFTQNLQGVGALATQEGRSIHSNTSDAIDNIIKSIDKYTSGEDALRAIQLATDLTATVQKADVMKNVNLVSVNAMGAMSEVAKSLEIKQNASLVQDIVKQLAIMGLNPDSWNSSGIKSGVSDVTTTVGGLILSDQPEYVSKAFESIARSLENSTDVNKIENLTPHFKELANSVYKGRIKTPDSSFDRPFIASASLYLENVGKMLNAGVDQVNRVAGVQKEDIRPGLPRIESAIGIGVEGDISARGNILPGGLVEISVENDVNGKYTKQFQNDIANRFNDVIKTYENIMNVPRKTASDIVLSKFGHLLNIPQEELPAQPQALKKENDLNAKDMIRQEEGFRNTAYLDSAGVPTIGYGFTQIDGKPVQIGDLMTRAEGEAELQKQLPKYQTFKDKIKVDLTQDQEAALTSFEYNLGSGIWDKGAKGILYAVNSGDFEYAKSLMLQYNKAKDPASGQLRILPGLMKRREREGTLLTEGR